MISHLNYAAKLMIYTRIKFSRTLFMRIGTQSQGLGSVAHGTSMSYYLPISTFSSFSAHFLEIPVMPDRVSMLERR